MGISGLLIRVTRMSLLWQPTPWRHHQSHDVLQKINSNMRRCVHAYAILLKHALNHADRSDRYDSETWASVCCL